MPRGAAKKAPSRARSAISRGRTNNPEALVYIAEDLRPLAVPIAEISPDPANRRVHGDKNIRAIMASLRRFGQRRPAVVNVDPEGGAMITEAGAGLLEAARRLKFTHLAVVRVQDDPITARDFGIADNRAAELATWDDRALLNDLQSLDPLERELLAFDDRDLTRLLRRVEGKGNTPDTPADTSPQLDAHRSFRVVVEQHNGEPLSEAAQAELLQRLGDEGYTCKALIA